MRKINLFFSSLFLSVFFAGGVWGAVFTVTKTADTNDGVCDADCSLREAVEGATGLIADNMILFSPGLNGSTITVAAPPLRLFGSKSIRIEGPGADLLTISGGNTTIIFLVAGKEPFDLRFAGMTLTAGRGGSPELGGAAIDAISSANIEIDRMYFTGNVVPSPGFGGAVFLGGGGNHRVSNSTFSANTSASCGALAVLGSPDTVIVNSTFSGNTATVGDGGAICLSVAGSAATLRNLTITGNNARNGGAIATANGTFNIGNSVISGNTAVNFPEVRRQTNGVVNSEGNNHIGDSVGDSTNTDFPVTWAASDVLNTPPALGTLQNNGGRMPTILPAKGSPLINSGSNVLASAGGAIDQRGYTRIAGAAVDKGAVEVSSAPASVKIAGRVTDVRGRALPRARVTLTDMSGNTRKYIANAFGYYYFVAPAAEDYFITASSLPNTFLTRLLIANGDLLGIDIGAQ
ncbi:MAG TPA: choice-of-anchor Q domain-containing protein [Pyrinomonadaceae bacterium]|nr:choice-of-anchor Q domain-containing protein [Pyrinomonadaceae bacterium]